MTRRRTVLILVLAAIIVSIVFLELQNPAVAPGEADIPVMDNATDRVQQKQERYPRAKELVNPTGFINTENITVREHIGENIVLLDIWTYSCINCVRTLPYLTAWHRKYKDYGLQIIGVHTPEFSFEKKRENVAAAVNRFNITYPVVLDNNYGTWAAYQNRYWPRTYLIGVDGFIRYDHIGEGAYRETEDMIQELLRERKHVKNLSTVIPGGYVTPDTATPSRGITPEIYLGAHRNEHYLGNGVPGESGIQSFTTPPDLERDMVYLNGSWDIRREYAETLTSGTVTLRYHAQDVFLVAGSENGSRVNVTVTVDGTPVNREGMGRDLRRAATGETYLTVAAERMYRVLETSDVRTGTLQLHVEQPGVKLYTFTFG